MPKHPGSHTTTSHLTNSEFVNTGIGGIKKVKKKKKKGVRKMSRAVRRAMAKDSRKQDREEGAK